MKTKTQMEIAQSNLRVTKSLTKTFGSRDFREKNTSSMSLKLCLFAWANFLYEDITLCRSFIS